MFAGADQRRSICLIRSAWFFHHDRTLERLGIRPSTWLEVKPWRLMPSCSRQVCMVNQMPTTGQVRELKCRLRLVVERGVTGKSRTTELL